MKIVAIGGGRIISKSTISIDKEIIRLSGKKHPKLLFIPTASADAEDYWRRIQNYFGVFLKCETDALFLIRERPSKAVIERKISAADIIYVGGGNTLMMMRRWRRLGVDKLLRKACGKETVLCGMSAGSICWFESGHSDSMSFYDPRKWGYINVRGLGFIKGINCPHYDSHTLGTARRKRFQTMIRKTGGFGIAIEDNCAIEFIDDGRFRVVASKLRAGAYKVYKKNGRVFTERIAQRRSFTPLAELYKTNLPPMSGIR